VSGGNLRRTQIGVLQIGLDVCCEPDEKRLLQVCVGIPPIGGRDDHRTNQLHGRPTNHGHDIRRQVGRLLTQGQKVSSRQPV
jgi:hypothetical protein